MKTHSTKQEPKPVDLHRSFRKWGGIATVMLTLFATHEIEGKPGGCARLAGHCDAKMLLEGPFAAKLGVKELELYFARSGYTSFLGVPSYAEYDIRDALASDTVGLEWEINRAFSGNHPELGMISCRVLTEANSNQRSQIQVFGDKPGQIFPGRAVHSLFMEITIPKLGITIFNKDPMQLVGQVRALDVEADIRKDPRVVASGRGLTGLPEHVRASAENRSKEIFFDPVGSYRQAKPVAFYLKGNPDLKVATITESLVATEVHYGIEIRYLGCESDGVTGDVLLEVRNISGKEQRLVWFIGDSHDIAVSRVEYIDPSGRSILTTLEEGEFALSDKPILLRVKARNKNPGKPFGDNACIFCGVQNVPQDLNAFQKDFVSDFIVVQRDDFKKKFVPTGNAN